MSDFRQLTIQYFPRLLTKQGLNKLNKRKDRLKVFPSCSRNRDRP